MKVKLSYFKTSGKWYTSGEFETDLRYFYQVISEVDRLRAVGELPGLVPRAGREFTILITTEQDSYGHLLAPSMPRPT